MEHVVFFPAPDGSPAFRRVSDFDEAVRFVEHLRNVENVTGASVHTLTEVPLSFRAWYRVELPTANTDAATVQQPTELDTPSDPQAPAAVEAAADAEAPLDTEAGADVEAPADGDAPAEAVAAAETTEDETASPDFGLEAPHLEAAGEAPEQSNEDYLVGSSTAVLVPVPDFAPSEPFAAVPIAAASLAHPFGENIVESPRPAPEPELEHASGNRRDRGLGFFAR